MGALAVLYGIQAAAGAGQAIFGMQQANQARAQEALLRAQGLPKMQTPQEYYDLYQNASRSRAFEQEKAMTESIMASNLNVLASAGSRALIGAAPGVTLQAQRGLAGAAERDFQRQQQALQTLAGAEGRTQAYNFQAESAQYARDLASAQAGYQAGIETAFSGAEQAIGAGFMAGQEIADAGKAKKLADARKQASQVVTPTLDAAGNVVKSDPGIVTPEIGFDQGKQVDVIGGEFYDYSGGFGVNPKAPTADSPVAPADPYSMVPTGNPPIDLRTVTPGSYSSQQEAAFKNPGAIIKMTADGRFIAQYAKGGSVTTPGKYTADHSVEYDVKTKGGKTIATVTGDETLVFNPEQRRFLKKVIGKLMTGGTIRPTKADVKAANKTLKAFKK